MKKVEKYKKQFSFNKNDFNTFGICNFAVLKIFQDVAVNHANLLGIGYDEMIAKNLLWVALKIKFEIIRQPEPDEVLTIETYPSEKNMFEYYRDYLIFDQNGKVVIKGESKWCLISSVTRRIARITEIESPIYEHAEPVFAEKLERLKSFESEFLADYTYQILPEDIDNNNHTNNTVYAKIVDEVLKNNTKRIKIFEIDFLKETLLGQRLDMFKLQENDTVKIMGKICEDKPSFVASVKFAE